VKPLRFMSVAGGVFVSRPAAFFVMLLLPLSVLGGCKRGGASALSAPMARDAGSEEIELPPSTSGYPLVGIRLSVTQSGIFIGEEQKQVATLESLGTGHGNATIVPLKDELLHRNPEYLFRAPPAYLYVDRRTPFYIVTRIMATAIDGGLGQLHFAGAGDGRIDELLHVHESCSDERYRPLLLAVSDGGAFVEPDARHCHGEIPAPNISLVNGAPDRAALERLTGPEELRSSSHYHLLIRASDSATYGEVAAFADTLSHVVSLGMVTFCIEPRAAEKRTP
jgi:hypothetical protein